MARARGARNADYEQTKANILSQVTPVILATGGAATSFRELARAAGLTPASLRHYFPTREAVLVALLADLRAKASHYLLEVASADRGPVRESLLWFLRYLVEGWQNGVGALHAFGLSAGLVTGTVGQAYVAEVLEPTLQAAEARLARHVASGELGPCELRVAALHLVGPIVLALLHQNELCGSRVRPLPMAGLLEEHLERFLRAYAAPAAPGIVPADPKGSAGEPAGGAEGRRRPGARGAAGGKEPRRA